jgi:hypothetical protein
MKRVLIWIAGVTVGGLLLLALIGYLSGPQKPLVDQTEVGTDKDQLAELKSTLQAHDLELCDAYHWIGNMENETRHFVETNQPALNAADKDKRIEFMREQEWNGYCIKHNLPDSIRTEINVYGMSECE